MLASSSVRPADDHAGHLLELSGSLCSARTTAAVSLVVRAQREGALVAWVQQTGGSLYPPDLAEAGVDLQSLVVVHVPREKIPKAIEILLRADTFALVVMDIAEGTPGHADVWQTRLGGILRRQASKLVLLTKSGEEDPSLGPWISTRIAPTREREAPGRFVLVQRVLKDKRGRALSEQPHALYRAPHGLG